MGLALAGGERRCASGAGGGGVVRLTGVKRWCSRRVTRTFGRHRASYVSQSLWWSGAGEPPDKSGLLLGGVQGRLGRRVNRCPPPTALCGF